MRDIDNMSEDELLRGIESLAPPARPFGMHAPDDIAYITDRVWQVLDDTGTPASEECVVRLVEMFLSEVEAVEDAYVENASQAFVDGINIARAQENDMDPLMKRRIAGELWAKMERITNVTETSFDKLPEAERVGWLMMVDIVVKAYERERDVGYKPE